MPLRRPNQFDLRPTPRRKSRTGAKPGPKARASRKAADRSSILYWVAGILLLLLVALVAIGTHLPQITDYFAEWGQPLKINHPAPAPAPQPEDDELARLQAKVNAEQKKRDREKEKREQELTAAQAASQPAPVPLPVTPPPAPAPVKTPPSPQVPLANDSRPPGPQPAFIANPGSLHPSIPARALPVDPDKLDTERIAAYQVALERMHFSCGFIDGDQGMRTQRMLRAFQASRGLPVTGFLDKPTRDAIGEPGEPFLNYTVTQNDLSSIMPRPTTWRAKSQATRLGYSDMWEMLAEKFHCTRAYLKALNRDVKSWTAGTDIIGPKVFPAAPIPHAASLRVLLSETTIEALDAGGRIIAFFPCSIAKDKAKRPNGELTVKSIVPNPDYTFDPALFADAAAREGLTKKMVLPPGPRNPVGTAWIGLSLPGYGIHGTPEPENISRTQSHGCFRLANWNAEKVLKLVKVGTPVDVQP